MRRLDLDFAERRPRWPAAALALVGVLLVGDTVSSWLQLRERARQLAEAASGVPRVVAPTEPMSDSMRREFDGARRLLAELAKPWDPMFRAIESSLDNEAALLSIEPDAARQSVQISGEARNFAAVLRFVDRLEKTGTLTRVHLLSHEVNEEAPSRPTQFSLSASWRVAP